MKFNFLSRLIKKNNENIDEQPEVDTNVEVNVKVEDLSQNTTVIIDILHVPNLGMRTIKTSIAVALSYLVFIPLNLLFTLPSGEVRWGATYACIAAIICMQSSVEQSVKQGVSRLIGTAIGGCIGLLILTTGTLLEKPMFLALMLCAGIMLSIWSCILIKMPTACSISGIMLCVILFNQTGPDRYIYALNRMFETAIGILVAVIINQLLPHNHKE